MECTVAGVDAPFGERHGVPRRLEPPFSVSGGKLSHADVFVSFVVCETAAPVRRCDLLL